MTLTKILLMLFQLFLKEIHLLSPNLGRIASTEVPKINCLMF